MNRRKYLQKDSNNKKNHNKNICALAVAEKLNVQKTVHYLHTINDLVRAARNKYKVRSRKSTFRAKTVGALRKEIHKVDCDYIIVRVDNHVLLLDKQGNTIVDTAPRKRDKRKITHVFGVWR